MICAMNHKKGNLEMTCIPLIISSMNIRMENAHGIQHSLNHELDPYLHIFFIVGVRA